MKKITKILCVFFCVLFIFSGCGTQNDVVVSNDVRELAQDTIDDVDNGKDLSTDGVISKQDANENEVLDEGVLEQDGDVEQENISYDGSNSGKGLKLLGKCNGLVYYSQADSRWANVPYTSTGNKTQTIKSSGCGTTSASMVVSSSKGVILPTTMSKLSVDNGYRTANNGTAWSFWSFVADYFDFNEYYSTSSDSKMLSYLKTDKNKDGVSDYFVVASCGSGLFTTGGHYITLVADKNGVITVYDPYLYNGKFNTASRKVANVKVSGTSAYVSEANFKKYANTKNYWVFSNDYVKTTTTNKVTTTKKVETTTNETITKQTMYVTATSLNVRETPNGEILDVVVKGTKVIVTKTNNGWSKIGTNKWVSSKYLSKTKPNNVVTVKNYKTVIGKTYKLKSSAILYSKGDLSGTKYSYKAKTSVKVIKHYSEKVDYVYISATGRYAYCRVTYFI